VIEYAGFWRRLGATLIDGLWMGLLLTPLLQLVYDPEKFLAWQTFLIENVLPALIVIFFWLKYQATPGKLLFDCDIVDRYTGQSINFKQAILRYVGYFIALLPVGLGFFWIIWDKRKQGWHDKIAGTVVVIHDEAHIPLQQLENSYH
jgi:uncharacterized RDD family membrane protein YckC